MSNKILFWMGSDLTHFCLASLMQKKLDSDFYAVYDLPNKPKKFFKNQQIVDFKKTWFFHDHIDSKKTTHDLKFLEHIEEKYGINLWRHLINERIFYRFYNFHNFSDDEMLSILEHECKLFENILSEIKPDFFITKEPAFHHLEIFYQMCKASGVKILMLTQPNIGYKCLISENANKLDSLHSIENSISSRQNFKELEFFLKENNLSAQLRNYDQNHGDSFLITLKAIFSYLVSPNLNIKTHYNYYGRTKFKVIFYMLIKLFQKKIRQTFLNNNLEKNPNLTKSYIYFPLAVDLERNLLIKSPYHTNQIEIIRHIAKSLPVSYSLYVKENPSQSTREWRSKTEYTEIMKIPNVLLIHPSFSSESLIKNSSLVINISGTSAFEAAFYNKPSIVFSDVGYSVLPSVFKVQNYLDLPSTIKTALHSKVNFEDVDKYICELEKNWFDFDWFGFGILVKDYFYYNGSLVDVDISNSKMKIFLQKYEGKLENLVKSHVEKIVSFNPS
jgi:hypothetical protein